MDASSVAAWASALRHIDRDAIDVERIDLIRALEGLKCAAAAAQAVLTADFDASQRAEQAAAGVPAERQGRGVAAQVALARRESPHRAQQHLGLAKILATELPHTMAAFRAGRITEWKATLVGRETGCLSLEDRRYVDRVVAGEPSRIEAMGDRELVGEIKKLAYRLDPASFVERRRRAEADRRVTVRPAPDVMTHLSALLPVGQGVAVFAALKQHADSLRAAGDTRGRGQIMADTLVQRVTGQTSAREVPVSIGLVLTDRSLLAGGDEPAHVDGYGPIPADVARSMAAASLNARCKTWLRRLFAPPRTGDLVAMDSRARVVPDGIGRFIDVRDPICRTPWCDAPVRHRDHVVAVEDGGETSVRNTQGLCEACNHAKQARGWQARPRPGPRHTVVTRTPTGHLYRSTAPPAPGTGSEAVPVPAEVTSIGEIYVADMLLRAG